jgi:hypothetical protein
MRQPNYEEKLKELMDLRGGSWSKIEFIEKGVGTKCPGKQRLVTLLLGHAPRGLNGLGQNESAQTFCLATMAAQNGDLGRVITA